MQRLQQLGLTTHPVKKYRLGFSRTGFTAILLPMIPNVLWVLLPPVSSTLPANNSAPRFVEVGGTVAQSLMMAFLVVVINTRWQSTPSTKVFAAVSVACLISYLVLWGVYFTAPITPMLLLMMAVLPSLYFICVALQLGNYPALIPASLFALIHTATTAASYL